MSDEVLKNYSRRTPLDEAMHAIRTAQNDGFDPYFWIPRGKHMNDNLQRNQALMKGGVTTPAQDSAIQAELSYAISKLEDMIGIHFSNRERVRVLDMLVRAVHSALKEKP